MARIQPDPFLEGAMGEFVVKALAVLVAIGLMIVFGIMIPGVH